MVYCIFRIWGFFSWGFCVNCKVDSGDPTLSTNHPKSLIRRGGEFTVGIWRLLNPGRVYSDTFCALWGAKKAKNFHFFMVCAISHSQLGYAQWPWFKKMTICLPFAPMESDLSVVRPPRLLWEIDLIMRKLANTNFMSWEATDNFLEGFEVAVATLWSSLFEVTGRGWSSVWV